MIARYLAAELQGPALEAFERHLMLCPDCVAFLQTYRATIALTREFLSGNGSHDPRMSLRLRKRLTNADGRHAFRELAGRSLITLLP